MSARVFLLSPANCRGRRAKQVLSPNSTFPVATRLRAEGVPIGDLFTMGPKDSVEATKLLGLKLEGSVG